MRLVDIIAERVEPWSSYSPVIDYWPERMAAKNLPIRFYNDTRDSHRGETFGTLWAFNPDAQRGFDPHADKTYGRIDWSRYGGEVQINMIEVEPQYRRLGLATALLDQLRLEFPDDEIIWSGTTPEGEALRRAYRG